MEGYHEKGIHFNSLIFPLTISKNAINFNQRVKKKRG